MFAIQCLSMACHTCDDYRGCSVVNEFRDINHFNTQMSVVPGVNEKKGHTSEATAPVKATSMAASRFWCKPTLHLARDVHSQPIAIYLLASINDFSAPLEGLPSEQYLVRIRFYFVSENSTPFCHYIALSSFNALLQRHRTNEPHTASPIRTISKREGNLERLMPLA